jgi:peptidoglycan/xylan/chitin deacetylase (PgdA/CDA1 family)
MSRPATSTAQTSTSPSGGITARNNLDTRRIGVWLLAAGLVIALIVGTRRWIHHAQLELVPIIVPSGAAASDIMHPPPRAIVGRMLLDVHDTFAPPQRARYAVLTFDDGPFPVATPALLAELRALRVPAVFFLIGRDAQEQPAIAQRTPAGQNEIGNHTLSHPEMTGLLLPAQLEEIADGATVIRRATGARAAYFRPPHGNWDANTLTAARAANETVVLWDIDPGDWRRVSPQAIVDNVTHHAKSPAVVLLHNGSEPTIEALPTIVAAYRRAGFTFVTLSELRRRLALEDINDPINVRL